MRPRAPARSTFDRLTETSHQRLTLANTLPSCLRPPQPSLWQVGTTPYLTQSTLMDVSASLSVAKAVLSREFLLVWHPTGSTRQYQGKQLMCDHLLGYQVLKTSPMKINTSSLQREVVLLSPQLCSLSQKDQEQGLPTCTLTSQRITSLSELS